MNNSRTPPLSKKRWSSIFSNWLPILLAILTIAFLPLTLLALSKVEETIIHQHGQILAETASSLARRLDRILFERYGDLQILSEAPMLQDGDRETMTKHLEHVQKAYQAFAWLGVTDRNGNILAATIPGTIGQNINTYPIVNNIQRHGTLQVQDAGPIPFLHNTLGIMYGAPIQASTSGLPPLHNFKRMIIFCMSLAYLTEEFKDQASKYKEHFPTGSQMEWHLLRQDGLALVDSILGEEGKANLRELDLPSVRAVAMTPYGYLIEHHRRRQVDVLTGYSRLEGMLNFPGFEWNILFRRDLDEITADVHNIQMKLGASGLLVLGPLFGLLIWSTARNRTNQELLLASAEHLQKSEAKFRAIVQHAPSGIALVNHQGTITLVNKLLQLQFGYQESELLGQPIEILIPQRFRPPQLRFFTKLMAHHHRPGMGKVRQAYGLHKNGSEFPLEIGLNPLLAEKDTFLLASVVDITERKKIQAEREQIITELERKNLELEQFTYAASHDLKSPLVTIRGFLGSIQHDLSVEKYDRAEKDLTRIDAAAESMQRLLDDLLEFYRAGHLFNPPEPVNVGTLAGEIMRLLETTLTKRGIQVTIASDFPETKGDHLRLYQLMQNLIENAIKFIGDQPHPRVDIGFRRDNGNILYFIQDNGLGIDPAYHQKIFGLFERLNEEIPGTGVGLAWVKRIIESHHGRIWVESKGLGHGSTFTFTLPTASRPSTNQGTNR